MDSSFFTLAANLNGYESMLHFSGLQASRFTLCPAIGGRGVSENTLVALTSGLQSLPMLRPLPQRLSELALKTKAREFRETLYFPFRQ